jgi:hypothetical protein
MTTPDAPLRLWLIARPSAEAQGLEAALGDAGAAVCAYPFPTAGAGVPPSTLGGLAGLASSVGAAFREILEGVDITSLVAQLETAGEVDGLVFLEADIAGRMSAEVLRLAPRATQVGVSANLDLDVGWSALGLGSVSARESGGVLEGLGDSARTIPGEDAHIAIACGRLPEGWVDSLLLQLNLAEIGAWPLLFLPSGEGGVDEQVKTRAAFYGLSGQRPGAGGDLDAWVRGAHVLVGRPTPSQLIAAIGAQVPVVLVGELPGDSGEAWAVSEGLAVCATMPVEVSVALEKVAAGDRSAGRALGDPARAATEVIHRVRHGLGRSSGAVAPDDPDVLEPIGVTPEASAHAEEPEALVLDDALARLKARMRSDSGEG